jgi:NAD(P)-dependent dehydrogenase (short-subunit alcohol dehydrogenase family)
MSSETQSGLVTGAGSGIGRAIAVGFAATGAAVMVADIDEAGGRETVAQIEASGDTARFLRVDVTDEAQVAAMVASTVENFGRLDFAVNNAGIEGEASSIDANDIATFDRIMAVNVRGVFLCLKHEIEQMRGQGKGAIVNMASANSFRTLPGTTIYTTSKHAVLGMTRNAAVDCASAGIRINAICPGGIETPMLTASFEHTGIAREDLLAACSLNGRFGYPEEVAKAAIWLCSDNSSYTYGHALAVDGGYLVR